ncbi:MAG: glutamine amidotransferase [Gammaproteobacteria bacterium]
MPKQAIAIRHVDFENLGSLADVLTQNNFSFKYLDVGIQTLSNFNPLQPDLLIVLGGPIGVYETESYPFLRDEIKLLKQRLAADLPTLGICLGAQLIAAALGANVYPGGKKEIGWFPLELNDTAKKTYFQHLAPEKTLVFHWHGDTFDLPKNAQLLASTLLYCNQAFTYGKNTLALQFHPEVTPTGLERWYIGHASELAKTAMNINQLRIDANKYGEKLLTQAQKFWQAWLAANVAP